VSASLFLAGTLELKIKEKGKKKNDFSKLDVF